MPFKKGKSGNAKGRPPKSRAWADLISKYGQEKLRLYDGTEITAQDLIAKLTIEGLVTGRVNFPRLVGQTRKPRALDMDVEDWIRFLGQTREHLEGKPAEDINLNLEDSNITFYIPDNGRDKKG